MIAPQSITGVILCGGLARRMGGVEKPLQLLNGAPLVQHVRERLAAQVGSIVISANRAHEQYAQWGDPVVADAEPELGPLGGLASVLPLVSTPWFFCCPGDAPFLHPTLVERLAHAAERNPCVYPTDGRQAQHLFLLGQRSLTAALDEYLAAGGRSVHGFLQTQQPAIVDAADIADSFRNINSLAELHTAAATLR